MPEILRRLAALSSVFVLLTMPVMSVMGIASPIQRYNGYSANWSGYAIVVGGETITTVSGNRYWGSTQANPIYSYTVSYVYGEWNVPEIKAGSTGYIGDVSVWVGIDGYDSGTVEQIGTSSEYNPSTNEISYYAWWEVYPKFSHRISAMTVKAGDKIKAYVKFVPEGKSKVNTDRGVFILSLTDERTGKSFTIAQGPLRPGFYIRSSAEWVVERAAFYDQRTKQVYFAELPEFNPITFTSCMSTITTPSSGLIHYDRMWMTAPIPSGYGYIDAYGTSATRCIIANTDTRTGDLLSSGTFTVNWVDYGTASAQPWSGSTPE